MGDCTPDIRDRVCFQAVTEPWFVESHFTFMERICQRLILFVVNIRNVAGKEIEESAVMFFPY